jgi:hypothetical protein
LTTNNLPLFHPPVLMQQRFLGLIENGSHLLGLLEDANSQPQPRAPFRSGLDPGSPCMQYDSLSHWRDTHAVCRKSLPKAVGGLCNKVSTSPSEKLIFTIPLPLTHTPTRSSRNELNQPMTTEGNEVQSRCPIIVALDVEDVVRDKEKDTHSTANSQPDAAKRYRWERFIMTPSQHYDSEKSSSSSEPNQHNTITPSRRRTHVTSLNRLLKNLAATVKFNPRLIGAIVSVEVCLRKMSSAQLTTDDDNVAEAGDSAVS